MNVILYGYKFSVYTWIARATLAEKGVPYEYSEINPFAPTFDDAYLQLHPFKRVPVLKHDDFTLYETSAITRYIDRAFAGPPLQPNNARELGRMTQIVSIIDAYAFQPMMRQAFTNRVVCEKFDLAPDEDIFAAAMVESKAVLTAINHLCGSAEFLCGKDLSLADLQLAPVIDYFQMFDEGSSLLSEFDKLVNWYHEIRVRPSIESTRPQF